MQHHVPANEAWSHPVHIILAPVYASEAMRFLFLLYKPL